MLNRIKNNKWLILRVIVYSWIIIGRQFDGEHISDISNVDRVAFCIIIPVIILFFSFGLYAAAGSNFAYDKWKLPNFNTSPIDYKNPPIMYFDIGNIFLATGIGAIVHCTYYDRTVFWVIATILGIGVSMHLVIFLSRFLLKWKYMKV